MSRLEVNREAKFTLNKEPVQDSNFDLDKKRLDDYLDGTVLPQELKTRAVEKFEQECEQDPLIGKTGGETKLNLAQKYYESGMDDMAYEMYMQCLKEVDYDTELFFDIYKNIGNIFVRSADYEAAEEYYNKAYSIDARSDILEVNYGTLAIQRENYEEAISRFRSAIEINKKNDKAWVGLSLIHRQYGDWDLAWANIEEALNCNPENLTACQLAFDWANADGRYNTLIQRFEKDLEDTNVDGLRPWLLGQLLYHVRRYKRARLVLQYVTETSSDNVAAKEMLSHVNSELSKQEKRFK